MRVVPVAFVMLSLGGLSLAAAQNYGPGPYANDPRSGPPPRYYNNDRPRQDIERVPYFTERAPPSHTGEGFRTPPYRGAPPEHVQRYGRIGDDRPDARPGAYPRDREPPPSPRQVERAPQWPEPGDRGSPSTVRPPGRPIEAPPPQRITDRRPERLAPRPAGRMMVSIEEFRDLENRVRELERLLNERHDFRDDRRGSNRPTVIYR